MTRERPSRPLPHCPRCGAPAEPEQASCLHCGARLVAPPGLARVAAAAWHRRFGWEPPAWASKAPPLLLVVVLGIAVALGARAARSASAPTLVPTRHAGTTTPPATTLVIGSAPATTAQIAPGTRPTITSGTLPAAPGAPSTPVETAPPPSPAPASRVAAWPRGRRGWTDVLLSVPVAQGRQAAAAVARRALRAGVPGAGVLGSADFRSLRDGYWVVFAGAYPSEAAAERALAGARTHGFAGAYPARVAP